MTIRIDSVTRRFRGHPAVDRVSLDVDSGAFVALLGPSGSGKTTLLRMIAGLDHPDEGRIIMGDRDVTGVHVRERRVGFVFQSYALFEHMSVAQNVAFGLTVLPRARRPDRATIDARVRTLLARVELAGFGDRLPSELSGGQRQRVALARALATDPRVLLLDEPFGALDALVRRDLRRWVRSFHASLGIESILVTHDQEEAFELADRVAVLNGGRIEQYGAPEDLLRNPASAFVEAFLAGVATGEARGAVARLELPEPSSFGAPLPA
mgnify:CR=1 FL=1